MIDDVEYTVEQVAKAAGITPRTVRNYAAAGVFDPPRFRGPATRYKRKHLERLRAIQALRKQGMRLETIKARFEADEAARAAAKLAAAEAAAAKAVALPAEAWERVTLVPGLELHVSSRSGALI